MTRDELISLADRRFAAAYAKDLEAKMATLIAEPWFELRPLGMQLRGQQNVRRYYEYVFSGVGSAGGHTQIDRFISEDSIAYELDLHYDHGPDAGKTYRLLAVMPGQDGRFTGERLYGHERIFRNMFGGPIWQLLEPLKD